MRNCRYEDEGVNIILCGCASEQTQYERAAWIDTDRYERDPRREGGSELNFQGVSEDRPEIDSFRTKNVD